MTDFHRETLEAQRTTPKLEGVTDGEICELWDYYGTKCMTKILDSGRELERKLNKTDPWFCLCGRERLLEEEGLMCTSCGRRQYVNVNERPGEDDWMKKKSVHTYWRWMEKRLRDRSIVTINDIGLIVSDFHKRVSVLRE